MKRFILALALVIGAAASGRADPCMPDTLAGYIGLGGSGCSIGGNLFSDFALVEGPFGATPIDPDEVQVVPFTTPGGVGLEFVVDATADAGEFFDLVFSYLVSGSPIGSAKVKLIDSAVTGDGANTGILDLCLGGAFVGGPFFCDGVQTSLIAFNTEFDELLSDSTAFPAVSTIGVVMDIGVDAGIAGSASLGAVDNVFGAVPEPSALVLVGMGLAASAFWRSWRRGIR